MANGSLFGPPPTGVGEGAPAQLASFRELSTFPEVVEQQVPERPSPDARRPASREGIFQSVQFSATWLPPSGGDDPRVTELTTYAVFGVPAPTRESPLLFTPGFEARFLDTEAGVDLPEVLYDAYLEVRWLRKLGELWGVDLAVSPGVHSDFEQGSDEAIRITGRTLLSYDWSPSSKLVFGAVYLDRDDVGVLPAGGWLWQPNDWTKMELIFPRPRIARRLRCQGPVEDWCYIAGEFGGGAWAIERADGRRDQLFMRDYRLLIGAERKVFLGVGGRVEVGYVFGREFEFDAGDPSVEPEPTVILRAAASY